MKICCFIGHRKINQTDNLISNLKKVIEKLIKVDNVSIFAFGSRSEFNDLCHEIVTNFLTQYPFLKRVCLTCRSEGFCLESEREKQEEIYRKVFNRKVHLQAFEEEIEYKTKYTSGKASYIERNQALIDMCDFCIFYYDNEYKPPIRKYSKNSFYYQPNSGTALAYKYAKQKKKQIINMFS